MSGDTVNNQDADLPDYTESMANDPPAPEYPGGDGDGSVKSMLCSGKNEESPLRVDVEEGDAPPSYTSIFGQIKDAKANSDGNLSFVKVLIGILLGSFVGIICIAISGAFPIAQLVIGIKYKDMCPIQNNIPIWLIASGALGICQVILTMAKGIVTKRAADGTESGGNCCQTLLSLIHLGACGLFIAGNIWVYKITNTVSYDPTNSTIDATMVNGTSFESFYCDKTCYLFAFWSITAAYIGLGVALLVCCTACVCFCFIASSN